MKKVAVLGSTGSIGTQTLDVIRQNSDVLSVYSLVAYSNKEKLNEQTLEFFPKYSALIQSDGEQCLIEAVKGADIAVVATKGIAALSAVLYCLDNGVQVALANKEVLVCAGYLVMPKVKDGNLVPIDSEHSAIMQCLLGRDPDSLDKIWLTASGGPFYDLSEFELSSVTAEDALKHPNWSMGSKITVDSATMMNKALEVLEASYLFSVPTDKIEIVVHRQSVVHSMVKFCDGSVMAQLAAPDMRLPIEIALLGVGKKAVANDLTLDMMSKLTFQSCNYERFPCAKLGYEIKKYPPLCATVMNAANDECVASFLVGLLPFDRFYNVIVTTIDALSELVQDWELNVENIEKVDVIARKYAKNVIDGEICC